MRETIGRSGLTGRFWPEAVRRVLDCGAAATDAKATQSMEPLEPTDLEIAELVRSDVKLFVESPDGFKQVSSNGPIVLMANSCAIVLTPITGEFAKKCKELHATGGLKPQDVRLGAFNASRYNAPGNKIMYYFRLSGVEIQVTIDPADSKLALDSVAEVVASLRLSESSAI